MDYVLVIGIITLVAYFFSGGKGLSEYEIEQGDDQYDEDTYYWRHVDDD